MLNKCLISGFADEIDKSLDVQIEVIHTLGQEYIEFRGADGLMVGRHTVEQAQAVMDRLDAAGIKVSSIGSPIGKIKITDDFEPHFEAYKRIVAIAKVMKTKYIRMFSFFMPKGEDPDQYEVEVCARLEKFIAYAKEQDVVLLHENEKGIYGDTAERVLDLSASVKGLHFVYDPANFLQVGESADKTLPLLHSMSEYFHIKDVISASGELVPAGEGDGQIPRLVEMIDRDTMMTVEPHLMIFSGYDKIDGEKMKHKFHFESNTEAFDAAVASLKNILVNGG